MIEFIAEFIAAPEVHLSAQVMHIHVNCHVDTYFRLHDFKERECPGEHSTRVGICERILSEREREKERDLSAVPSRFLCEKKETNASYEI